MANLPRKSPRQSRSRATAEAVLDAAAHILDQQGRSDFTTNHVAEKAGISIGSLYQYFPNKETILAELLRRDWQRLTARLAETAHETSDPQARLQAWIDVAIDHQFARPRLSLRLETLETTLDLDEEMENLAQTIVTQISATVRRYAPSASDRHVRDVLVICRSLINDAALDSTEPTDQKNLRERLGLAVFGYLDALNASAQKGLTFASRLPC